MASEKPSILLAFADNATFDASAIMEIEGAGNQFVIAGPLSGGGTIISDGGTLATPGGFSLFTGTVQDR